MNVQYQRHLAIGLALTVVLTGLLILRHWDPSSRAVAPTVPTGASFNLTLSQFRSDHQARLVAANIERAGFPAFTRIVRKGEWRQVIVGPYVSIDEAEAAQRLLARRGFGHGRMLVDESVRRTPGLDAATGSVATSGLLDAGIVVVGAAGRVSVVLELRDEPRQVVASRSGATGGTMLEIDAGPLKSSVGSRHWSAPQGVDLVEQVSVGEHDEDGARFMRTRLTVPQSARHNVRVVGRRVYIDLWSPQAGPIEVRSRRAAVAVEESGPAAPPPPPAEEYGEALRPAVARFDEIEPFLISAVTAPNPDVLPVMEKTLVSLKDWMRTIAAPAESAGAHESLVVALNEAVTSVKADFDGDRAGQARDAIARFRASLPLTTDN